MTEYIKMMFQMFIVNAPLLIVYLIGFALAIGKRHLSARYTYAAIGFTVLFFEVVLSRFMMQFLIQYFIDHTAIQMGMVLTIYNFVSVSIQAVGVILILLALYKQDSTSVTDK